MKNIFAATDTDVSSADLFFLLIKIVIHIIINIMETTKEGSAAVMNEDDYNAMPETLYVMSTPGICDERIDI